MKKKLDELTKPPLDVNSPEAQEILRQTNKDIDEIQRSLKKWMKDNGIGERNENNRNMEELELVKINETIDRIAELGNECRNCDENIADNIEIVENFRKRLILLDELEEAKDRLSYWIIHYKNNRELLRKITTAAYEEHVNETKN